MSGRRYRKEFSPEEYQALGRLAVSVPAFEKAEAAYNDALQRRDQDIRDGKRAGLTLNELADAAHMSRGRVQQIAPGGD